MGTATIQLQKVHGKDCRLRSARERQINSVKASNPVTTTSYKIPQWAPENGNLIPTKVEGAADLHRDW